MIQFEKVLEEKYLTAPEFAKQLIYRQVVINTDAHDKQLSIIIIRFRIYRDVKCYVLGNENLFDREQNLNI